LEGKKGAAVGSYLEEMGEKERLPTLRKEEKKEKGEEGYDKLSLRESSSRAHYPQARRRGYLKDKRGALQRSR